MAKSANSKKIENKHRLLDSLSLSSQQAFIDRGTNNDEFYARTMTAAVDSGKPVSSGVAGVARLVE